VMDLGLLGDCQHTARQKYQRTAKVWINNLMFLFYYCIIHSNHVPLLY